MRHCFHSLQRVQKVLPCKTRKIQHNKKLASARANHAIDGTACSEFLRTIVRRKLREAKRLTILE